MGDWPARSTVVTEEADGQVTAADRRETSARTPSGAGGDAEPELPSWLRPVAEAASKDLDAVELLNTTQEQVSQTVTVVANYGGSLDTILEDA